MASPTPVPETMLAAVRAVASGTAHSRASISRHLDMARSTVGVAVESLIERGLLAEVQTDRGGRGRPIRALALGPLSPTVGIIELAPDRSTLAVADLTGTILDSRAIQEAVSEHPADTLNAAITQLDALQPQVRDQMRQVVLGIPAQVNAATGTIARSSARNAAFAFPPLNWEDYPIAAHLTQTLGVPVEVVNDAHLLALGDAARRPPIRYPLIRLHASFGCGAGILDDKGDVMRGIGGYAGDVGHISVAAASDRTCWCGKRGCIGMQISLYSIAEDLDLGESTPDSIVKALRERIVAGDRATVKRIWQAADALGDLAAILVDIINPAHIVLSGKLIGLSSEVLARVRSMVYERAVALSSRQLQITVATGDSDSILPGAANLGTRLLLTPVAFRSVLNRPPGER